MTLPAFASSVRGYDRQQVDDYVATLLGYLDEAAQRLEELQEHPPASAVLGRLADRLTVVMAVAETAATERLRAAERAVAAGQADLADLAEQRRQLQEALGAALGPRPTDLVRRTAVPVAVGWA